MCGYDDDIFSKSNITHTVCNEVLKIFKRFFNLNKNTKKS